ncbi:hypothetical protein HC928_17370 [bacterium]|nr:hypothetical protein [bacterium]
MFVTLSAGLRTRVVWSRHEERSTTSNPPQLEEIIAQHEPQQRLRDRRSIHPLLEIPPRDPIEHARRPQHAAQSRTQARVTVQREEKIKARQTAQRGPGQDVEQQFNGISSCEHELDS